MLKRTKGRFLLTVLVITGLAGTIKTSSLSKEERKLAINELKDSKTELLKSIKGLSEEQLNFKPAPQDWSIRECVYHIALAEKGLWQMLSNSMKQGSRANQPNEKVPDQDIISLVTNRNNKIKAPETLNPEKAGWKSASEAIAAFKLLRNDHIKYTKSTTEGLRDHYVKVPVGQLDAYQFILYVSAYSKRHIQQINELKADPRFPKE